MSMRLIWSLCTKENWSRESQPDEKWFRFDYICFILAFIYDRIHTFCYKYKWSCMYILIYEHIRFMSKTRLLVWLYIWMTRRSCMVMYEYISSSYSPGRLLSDLSDVKRFEIWQSYIKKKRYRLEIHRSWIRCFSWFISHFYSIFLICCNFGRLQTFCHLASPKWKMAFCICKLKVIFNVNFHLKLSKQRLNVSSPFWGNGVYNSRWFFSRKA